MGFKHTLHKNRGKACIACLIANWRELNEHSLIKQIMYNKMDTGMCTVLCSLTWATVNKKTMLGGY